MDNKFENGDIAKIDVVRGSEGLSLQLGGNTYGRRLVGPKAWGNPMNHPLHSFEMPVKELFNKLVELWPELLTK